MLPAASCYMLGKTSVAFFSFTFFIVRYAGSEYMSASSSHLCCSTIVMVLQQLCEKMHYQSDDIGTEKGQTMAKVPQKSL